MLQCFKRDLRIKSIKDKDQYLGTGWQKHGRNVTTITEGYQNAALPGLAREMLHSAFASTHRETVLGTNPTAPARRGRFEDVLVTNDMRSFFQPTHRQLASGSSIGERLDRQVSG